MSTARKLLTPLGKCLRKLRVDADCNQRELASALNVSNAYISAVELGHRTPNDAMISSMVHFFDRKGLAAGDEIRRAARLSMGSIRIDFSLYSASFREKLLELMADDEKERQS